MKLSKQNNKQLNFRYRAVIIGSFRKHYPLITNIIKIFNSGGIEVLSPKHSKIINPNDEFVLFDYDPKDCGEKEIEDAVLKKINQSHFVYLVNPNGYVGVSASFEVGYCAAHSMRVFSMEDSNEMCVRYITGTYNPKEMVKYVRKNFKSLTK